MKLYNSLTKKIEDFKSIKEGEVSMYACGPTVYNYPHIGNARPIVVFDTLKKTLEALGYKVTYVSNFTDVDDKIINKAIEEGTSEKEVSERYIKAYNDDRLSLNADIPDKTPKVTETMDQIISFIKDLEDNGFAYEVNGNVYFRVSKVKEYGQLSGQKIEDLVVGARIDADENKENPLDFALWKQTDQGIKWDSPWGKGRPGWHTECVVMINNEFDSPLIDIHGGGMDLKFPHHENEIAQNEALYHSVLANYWIHNGMINIDGEKMSKSIGNVIWAKDFVAKLGGNLVRWIMISTHYRAPLNLNEDTIETARAELEKLQVSMRNAEVKLELANEEIDEELLDDEFKPFIDAMADDLNTPNALKELFNTNKKLNASLRTRELDYKYIGNLVYTLERMLYVLGIKLDRVQLNASDRRLFADWRAAVKEKKFEIADGLRKELQEKGLL